jgi:hypothetical protein
MTGTSLYKTATAKTSLTANAALESDSQKSRFRQLNDR